MSILWELGDGQGACLCVEKFQMNLGPWIHYRWSETFQMHVLVIGLIAFKWRLRSYKYLPRPSKELSK